MGDAGSLGVYESQYAAAKQRNCETARFRRSHLPTCRNAQANHASSLVPRPVPFALASLLTVDNVETWDIIGTSLNVQLRNSGTSSPIFRIITSNLSHPTTSHHIPHPETCLPLLR